MNWDSTGHGVYVICSFNWCFSHSHKDYNCVDRSFSFDEGDLIYMEYDPAKLRLRFTKNKFDNFFEMPIIPCPEND